MHALRQKCRPKHQLLILKCYPKLPKNTTATEEIKPNGSELSYLLYYASSRRSKLTKVGIFLEKKTVSDVKHSRTPAVMVTLQILAAFLNSSEVGGGKDGFALFAPYVLRILQEVLNQGSAVDLVDEALPVWTSVCGHQDHATLAGDGEYRALFASVVNTWASFATKNGTRKTMGRLQHLSASDEIRIRKAGLEAMRAIATSEALQSEPQRQIDLVMDVILQNLWAEDAAYLVMLDARDKAEKEARAQKDGTMRGRLSMNTVRTKTSEEGDARAAGGTAADADKIAEEEAGLLALRCLKSIYEVDNNRGQIRWATSCVLAYITQQDLISTHAEKGIETSPWATALVKMVCNWAPVQDRFVVLFIAVETLIRTPITEDQLKRQLVLSHIIGQVLASNTNLIGLSIMDILLGLVQHVLLILQIGTQHPVLNAGDITSSEEDFKPSSRDSRPQSRSVQMEIVKTPSPARVELLAQLRRCIASLATHVYYTDQISDMVSAILLRLKPSAVAAQNPAIVVSAIENPDTTAAEVASNSSLRERPNTDGFFSFDTAREVALLAVKDIMAVVNSTHHDGSTTHNPVPIGVWEGTQWLLRDSSDDVRRAYVDALCTWLVDETDREDKQLEDKALFINKRKENGNGAVARRAVSNASMKYRGSRRGHSTFLQLLHLAVYEEALQRANDADSDGEFMLLHLLLATLCDKLGMNAVRTALPMVFRLQEDTQQVVAPQAKIRLGTLVHGYLSSLVSIYGLGATFVGTEVASEIARRKQHNIWLEGVQVPPVPSSQINTRVSSPAAISGIAASMEALKPFDHRAQLVDALSEAYTESVAAPVTSPPTSPGGRSFSLPLLSDAAAVQASYLKPPSTTAPARSIPATVVEELNASWSKEILLAALTAGAPKSLSLSGSRTHLNAQSNGNQNARLDNIRNSNGSLLFDHRNLLASASFPLTNSADLSPTRSGDSGAAGRSRTASRSGTAGNGRRATVARSAKSRTRTNTRTTAGTGGRTASASTAGGLGPSSTRANSVAGGAGASNIGVNHPSSRIEDLKRALATGNLSSVAVGTFGLGGDAYSDDEDDDSMVEVEGSEYPESQFGDYPPSMSGYGDSAAAGGVPGLDTIPDTTSEATPRPMAHLRDPMEDSGFASNGAIVTGGARATGLGVAAADIGDSIVEISPENTAESNIPAFSLPGTFNLHPDPASTGVPTSGSASPARAASGVYGSVPAGSAVSFARPISGAGSGVGGGARPGSRGRQDLASLLDSVGLEDGHGAARAVTPPY